VATPAFRVGRAQRRIFPGTTDRVGHRDGVLRRHDHRFIGNQPARRLAVGDHDALAHRHRIDARADAARRNGRGQDRDHDDLRTTHPLDPGRAIAVVLEQRDVGGQRVTRHLCAVLDVLALQVHEHRGVGHEPHRFHEGLEVAHRAAGREDVLAVVRKLRGGRQLFPGIRLERHVARAGRTDAVVAVVIGEVLEVEDEEVDLAQQELLDRREHLVARQFGTGQQYVDRDQLEARPRHQEAKQAQLEHRDRRDVEHHDVGIARGPEHAPCVTPRAIGAETGFVDGIGVRGITSERSEVGHPALLRGRRSHG
jgi:hypothetical protein